MTPEPVTHLAVVVPAHDEQDWIEACLAALRVAAVRAPVPVDLLVVADSCRGATAARATAMGVPTHRVGARNVGVARAHGWQALCPDPSATTWLATTDADTLVPPDWLTRMKAHADAGWDAVAGTVQVRDWGAAGRPGTLGTAWQSAYAQRNDHVHGANLGVRGSALAAAGGVPPHDLAEDSGLVARLRTAGARVLHATDIPVLTSARISRRAPGGFSSYLDDLDDLDDALGA